jgi:aminoglycoside N3'-acetyltransferase
MAATRADLIRDLHDLGISTGDAVMVHASLCAVGPVAGGPAELVAALKEAVGPEGTLVAFVSWDRSPGASFSSGIDGHDFMRAHARGDTFEPSRPETVRQGSKSDR